MGRTTTNRAFSHARERALLWYSKQVEEISSSSSSGADGIGGSLHYSEHATLINRPSIYYLPLPPPPSEKPLLLLSSALPHSGEPPPPSFLVLLLLRQRCRPPLLAPPPLSPCDCQRGYEVRWGERLCEARLILPFSLSVPPPGASVPSTDKGKIHPPSWSSSGLLLLFLSGDRSPSLSPSL